MTPQSSITHVLSVRQPFASLMFYGDDARGLKNVENRTRRIVMRTRIWIHAAASKAPRPLMAACGVDPDALVELPQPRRVILGSVRVVDCVRDHDSPWALPGHWHWVLDDPEPLDVPVPVLGRGQVSLWHASRVEGLH